MNKLALYDEPELYDLVTAPNAQAEAFYIYEASRRNGSVVDLACGSGRLSIPLAKSGKAVFGVDISSAMLERARDKATAAGIEVTWIHADMRDFDVGGRRFGLITIGHNSLLHLTSTNDIQRCLRTAARHLAPGGALTFDVFVPGAHVLARVPGERRLLGRFTHDRLGELTLEETSNYDAASQISEATWYWSTQKQPDFLVTPMHLRQIFPQELPMLLEFGGFRLVARYGNFDRCPFNSQSPRQVCVCEPV